MSILLATEKDHDEIIKVMATCFDWNVEDMLKERKNIPINNHEQFFVYKNENNEIESLLSVVSFDAFYEGNVVKYGGIAGVSTLPQYRKKGNIRKIMEKAIEYMYENNMIISGLGPFKFEFYRQFGYEWCYDFQIINCKLDYLKDFKKADSYKTFTYKSANIVERFRNKIICDVNGAIYRDDHFIKQQWDKYKSKRSKVIGAYYNHKLVSYMIINFQKDTIKVDEMYYQDESSRQYLLGYLSKYIGKYEKVEFLLQIQDNLRTILPSPRITTWRWPNMMGRIIDVKKVLELYKVNRPFKKDFNMKVVDYMNLHNNKTFNISYENNKLIVKETDEKDDICININRLSQLLFGFLSAKELIEIGEINISNKSTIPLIESLFTKRKTMIWQEF